MLDGATSAMQVKWKAYYFCPTFAPCWGWMCNSHVSEDVCYSSVYKDD